MGKVKNYTRGPAWAYVVGGAFGLPALIGFVFGLFRLPSTDLQAESTALVGVGALLGWILWRAFSKSKAPAAQVSTADADIIDKLPATSHKSSEAPPISGNYIVRHWHGDLPLGVSYWVNGGVLLAICGVLMGAIDAGVRHSDASLRITALAGVSEILFFLLLWVWSVVGIYRSAAKHISRGGSKGWAGAAQVMVALGILSMGATLVNSTGPRLVELTKISVGADPIGNIDVKVSENGKAVVVTGMLREGSAVEVERVLNSAPGATSLVLNSKGGRLIEAEHLAHLVRERNLNTYVEAECVSACTYVLLAGKDRAATPNARIGFHQPTLAGVDHETQVSISGDMEDVYRTAGLPEAFVQRIGETSASNMWYPTRDELVKANVLNRVSLGGEGATFGLSVHSKQELMLQFQAVSLMQDIERRFPGTIQSATDKSWEAMRKGAVDADVVSASREIISDVTTKVVKTAKDDTLIGFTGVVIGEMTAARAISADACNQYLAGKLNVYQSLPKEIFEKEGEWLSGALRSAPREDGPVDSKAATVALVAALKTLPPGAMQAATKDAPDPLHPGDRCDGVIAMYKAIDALPEAQRVLALRGMLQSN